MAARAEGIAAGEIEALLARPDFAVMLAAAREMQARPEAEQLANLVRLARVRLLNTVVRGDLRAACFIADEHVHSVAGDQSALPT